MPKPTRPAPQSSPLGGTCSVVGHLFLWGGVVALALICTFAFPEWSGYGRLVLATYGTASAGCIALGLALLGCARLLAPRSERGAPAD